MCAHEEFAVAMANGYARVTGKPMATGLHNVVGLQHASMAIFNAWCDRTPMLNLGGGGPQDATHRRSTDWVHDVPSLGVPLGPSVRERGALQPAIGPDTVVIHITLYDLEKQSWVTDNMWMMPVSVPIAADTAQAIPELVRLCRERLMSSTGSADRVEQRRVRVHAMHRQAREEADAWTQQVWDQEPHIFGPALW
jgi:hypothetical protein